MRGCPSRRSRVRSRRSSASRCPTGFEPEVRALAREAFERELRPIPGVEAALTRLRVPRCVASSTEPVALRASLEHTGLWDSFAPHVFSASQVARGKPAPDLFLLAASTLGVAPSRCTVVEDSPFGCAAGAAAGMRVLGFVGGGHCGPEHADALREAGATLVFEEMEVLPDLVG